MPQAIDEEKMTAKFQANQTFDMHAPPLKNIPHMEFPKMLYLWPKDKTLPPTSKTAIAANEKEEKALLKKGYRTQPHVQEFPGDLPEGFEPDLSQGN